MQRLTFVGSATLVVLLLILIIANEMASYVKSVDLETLNLLNETSVELEKARSELLVTVSSFDSPDGTTTVREIILLVLYSSSDERASIAAAVNSLRGVIRATNDSSVVSVVEQTLYLLGDTMDLLKEAINSLSTAVASSDSRSVNLAMLEAETLFMDALRPLTDAISVLSEVKRQNSLWYGH